MEVDHELVAVDEFDALAIEVKVSPKAAPFPAPISEPGSMSEPPSASSATASGPAPGLQSSSASASSSSQAERDMALAREKMRLQMQLDELDKKLGKFPAKTHARKIARELGVNHGFIYVPGQEEQTFEDSDSSCEFRQRRYFYYLSGADFAGCAVTYDIARDRLILWIPIIDPKTVLWFGTLPTPDECRARVDVDDVRNVTTLEKYLHLALAPGSTLFVLHADQAPRLESTRGVVHIDTTHLLPAADAARVVKTDYEVAMIRRANLVSSAAHRLVLARLRRLANEREVDAIFRGFCAAQGARRQAYPVIAGAGDHASTLHYWQNDAPLAGRQLMVLDAAAEWDCYAADITRTFPLSGAFSPEAAEIYAVVQRMQDDCVSRIRPGLLFYSLHLHASMVAAAELLRLGILHGGTAAEIFARGTVAAFFPHGLGHHVGLEVHDVSGRERLLVAGGSGSGVASVGAGGARRGAIGKRDLVGPEALSMMYRESMAAPPPYKGRQRLVKNMIVTVEPGIYFCRDYIQAYFLDNPIHAKYINADLLEKYYPVGGVRIEDCILVTEDGHENLSTAPKGEEALKIINGAYA